jgi:PilZ domain-containing protein
MPNDDDRRHFQRLHLTKPILALARGSSALILDLGIAGALLEHYGEAEPGERMNLSFSWMGDKIDLACEVVRSEVVRPVGGDHLSKVSHSGVQFTGADEESLEALKDLIVTQVGRVLAAQRANAAGEPGSSNEMVLEDLGRARRMRTRGYVSYRLKDGRWWRIPTKSAAQPADGFTIAAYEDEEEVHTLCAAYERANEESRRLIRLVAELSALAAK